MLIVNSGKEVIVNSRQSECFQYYISSARPNVDIVISYTQYEGSGELYASVQRYPTSRTSSSVVMVAENTPAKTMILTLADRQQWGVVSGLYYICVDAYEDTSFNILIQETTPTNLYTLADSNLINMRVQNSSNTSFIYSNQDLAYPCTLRVRLKSFNQVNNEQPPKIFFKVCSQSQASQCSLSASEA